MRMNFRQQLTRVAFFAVAGSMAAACGGDSTSPAGSNTDPITNNPGTPNTPGTPTSSANSLSFVRTRVSSGKTIWQLGVVDADGANLHFVTDTLWEILGADFSPDGTRIAFAGRANSSIASTAVAASRPLGLWVVNRDGSGLTRLGTTPAFFPKWTPNGSQILFSQGGVWIINADGTSPRPITPETSSDVNPVMSPDGRWIAFNRMSNDGAEAQLYVMDVSGVNQLALSPPARGFTTPAWSADARRVAFVYSNAVRVINYDGSGSGMLSSMVPSGVSSIAWRSDDKAMAYTGYTTCCTGDASLYTVDMATGVRTRITPAGAYTDLWPVWAPKR